MIGDSDRYDPERFERGWADTAESFAQQPNPERMRPAIGSSSMPFEGDIEHLLKFCDQAEDNWSDENWDGCHVAVNAKSDGEAEVHGTNGRVRLVVATETTRDDCVALLMHPTSFRMIYEFMRSHSKRSLDCEKMEDERQEISWQSSNLKSEIRDLEEYLLRLQTSGPAAVATSRYEERLSELRVRLENTERRTSELKNLREKESDIMDTIQGRVFGALERVFGEANLLHESESPPSTRCYTDSLPSPSVERPISYIHGEDSPSKIYEGGIDDGTQFPSLSTARVHGPSETSSVDAKVLQSVEQQKRGSAASSDYQTKNSPLNAVKGEDGEKKQEAEEHDYFIHSGSEDGDQGSVRKEEELRRN